MLSSKSGITQQPVMELLYVTPFRDSAPPSGIGALNTKNERFRLWPNQGAHRPSKVLQMLAAVIALVLAVHWCILQRNNLASTNVLIRRLASGEKGDNQEERAGRAGVDACESLYTATGSQELGTSETSPAAQQVLRRMLNEESAGKREEHSPDANVARDSTTVHSMAARALESAMDSMEGLNATTHPPRDTITASSSPRSEKAADRNRQNSGSFATASNIAVTKQKSDDNLDLSNKHCIKKQALISTLRGNLRCSSQSRKRSATAASTFTSAVQSPTRPFPIEPTDNDIYSAPIPLQRRCLEVANTVSAQIGGENYGGVSQLHDEHQGTSANQALSVSRESMLKPLAPSTCTKRAERPLSKQRSKAKQARLLPKVSANKFHHCGLVSATLERFRSMQRCVSRLCTLLLSLRSIVLFLVFLSLAQGRTGISFIPFSEQSMLLLFCLKNGCSLPFCRPCQPTPPLTGTTLRETTSALEQQEPDYEKHPFYRLPPAGPTMGIEPFDTDFALTIAAPAAGAAAKLDPIRQIFLKPQISAQDMQQLVRLGEQLVAYAQKYLAKEISLKSNWRLSESMARRFLVADALWCICNIVGPAMQRGQWWDQILGKIGGHEALVDHVNSLSSPNGPTFLARIVAALEQYKRGDRPAPREVVELKMRILRQPCVTEEFRRPQWDPWRNDDKHFRGIS
ncbi:hypothetical protein, conserved [Eimeria tenella]|uniref:Transmembrane protein n=1 Tax=Eimeria tenella TaxID=5802 RepID=U6L1D4_EIMTE|nr:hypothetical protein, conserved [Eimeria tenella]CDJ43003.1 hypothetical protein, conserved [Eimeria tenella]|eukprot:XP_013233753.1 hypothetical protein, conserved [Eimeria tenella]